MSNEPEWTVTADGVRMRPMTELEKRHFLLSARQSLPKLPEDVPLYQFVTVPDEVSDDRLGSVEVSWRTQAGKRGWKLRRVPNSNGRTYVRVPDGTPRKVTTSMAIAEMTGPGGEAMAALAARQRGMYRESMTPETGDLMCDLYNHRDTAERIGDLEAAAKYQALGDAEYARLEALEKAEDAEYEAGRTELARLNDAALLYGGAVVEIPRTLEAMREALSAVAGVVGIASDPGVPAYDEDENGPDWSDLDVPDDDVGSDEVPV